MTKNISEISERLCAGNTYLVKLKNSYGTFHVMDDPIECKVKELSPTGRHVKLLNIYGKQWWTRTSRVEIIEILESITGTGDVI